MNTFKKDYNIGLKNEVKIFNLIKSFDADVKMTPPSHVIDYISSKYIYELKTRNCDRYSYDTTIVGYNKLLYADNQEKQLILIFSFKDGVYYVKYDKDFKYTKRKYVRNPRTDYIDVQKDYVFIPVSQLIPISTLKDQFNSPAATI